MPSVSSLCHVNELCIDSMTDLMLGGAKVRKYRKKVTKMMSSHISCMLLPRCPQTGKRELYSLIIYYKNDALALSTLGSSKTPGEALLEGFDI